MQSRNLHFTTVGWGANPLGAPTQYIYTFSEKPHKIKEISVRRGARAGSTLPKSATVTAASQL